MKNLTEKEVKEYFGVSEVIDVKVYEISDKLIKYGDYGIGSNWNVESFNADGENISLEIYHTWSYGGCDTEYISFPQSYLWIDNYEELIKIAFEKDKKEKKEKEKTKELRN